MPGKGGMPMGMPMMPMMNPQMMAMMQQKGGMPGMMPMMGKPGAPAPGPGMMPMMGKPGAPAPTPTPTAGLTAAALAHVDPAQQKQMLGERLFAQIAKKHP